MKKFFMANHSPKGVSASFALGTQQKGGGFMLQDARVPKQEIYIGTFSESTVKCLPFYTKATNDYRESFVKADNSPNLTRLTYFTEDEMNREYDLDVDRFIARDGVTDITYSLYTPLVSIPNPELEDAKKELAPLVMSELIIDNSENDKDIIACFGIGGIRGIRFLQNELVGVATIDGYGFCAKSNKDITLRVVADFDPIGLFGRESENFVQLALAPMGALVFDVRAHQRIAIDICLGFFVEGIATQGTQRCRYYYTKYFNSIDEVFRYGLDNPSFYKQTPKDDIHEKYSKLDDERRFLLAHSSHSYYTSSMLFEREGKPFWMINEGSFMMMSTFDLTIDHSFFDLMLNPWLVENLIESYINYISYEDKYGISFTHDFGSFNTFTEKGFSSYEISNQDGCFSYMSQEQLCNFILYCGLYYKKTHNEKWLKDNAETLLACFASMLNRDNPDPSKRNGLMSFDSDRCGFASEITTYDSLDPSLGQARDNLYIATKCLASYILMEYMLKELKSEKAIEAQIQAKRACETICSKFDSKLGYIPAVFDGKDKSAIIPAIEALIYPYYCGLMDRVEDKFLELMKLHFTNIMKKGVCIFDDDGWKLSSNNDNSWISKIFLCQAVAEKVFGFEIDKEADVAHRKWWTEGCNENPAIDQIFAGKVTEVGFHYPRAVTNFLFL